MLSFFKADYRYIFTLTTLKFVQEVSAHLHNQTLKRNLQEVCEESLALAAFASLNQV